MQCLQTLDNYGRLVPTSRPKLTIENDADDTAACRLVTVCGDDTEGIPLQAHGVSQ